MARIILVLIALCALSFSSCEDLQDLMMSKRKRLRFCGDQLIQTLTIVCDHNYNKRTNHMLQPERFSEAEELEGQMWRDRRQALAFLNQPRVRRGVVDECCSKSCTIKELSSYCADPTK